MRVIDTYDVCSACLVAVEYPDENNNRPHYDAIQGSFPEGTVSAHAACDDDDDDCGYSSGACELCNGLPGTRHRVVFLGKETA